MVINAGKKEKEGFDPNLPATLGRDQSARDLSYSTVSASRSCFANVNSAPPVSGFDVLEQEVQSSVQFPFTVSNLSSIPHSTSSEELVE